LAFGTVDTWLIHKLTRGRVHAADRSNASRTMLLNLDGTWDPEMLALFGVPAPMLPRVAGSSETVGAADASLFGAEIPIAGIAGDQQAALVGQACFRPGLSKNTYGTGCFFRGAPGPPAVAPRHPPPPPARRLPRSRAAICPGRQRVRGRSGHSVAARFARNHPARRRDRLSRRRRSRHGRRLLRAGL